MMKYEIFKDVVENAVLDYLPPEFQNSELYLQRVKKVNGMDYDGLVVRKEDTNVCPVINLTQLYEDYKLSEDIELVIKNAADIVKFRGIKANLVSVHVERLVQEGYLERREVPGDRRKTELICTEKAAHVWKQGCEIQRVFFEMLFSGVPEESRKIFERVMEQTEKNLNMYQRENKKK